MNRTASSSLVAILILSILGACSKKQATEPNGAEAKMEKNPNLGPWQWPNSLRTMGDGFPAAGDVCRRVGESTATVDFLDDSSTLIGCPGAASGPSATIIAKYKGRVAGAVDGVTLISIPTTRLDAKP